MYRFRASVAALPLLVWGCAATPTGGGSTSGGGGPGLGPNASLEGRRPFPADNPWNTPVDQDPVDTNSDALIASIGLTRGLHPDFGASYNGGPFGIPYIVVDGSTPAISVTFDYADESDPGPYPIPAAAPIEGGSASTGDRHVLVIDRDHWKTVRAVRRLPRYRNPRLDRRVGRDLRSRLRCPAPGRVDLSRRRRPADLPRSGALR